MTPEQRDLARRLGLSEREANGGAEMGRRVADRFLADRGLSPSVEQPPKRPWFDAGVELLADGKPDAALQEFERSLSGAVDDQKADSLYNMAVCHVRLGNSDAALRAIGQAVTLDPSLADEIKSDNDFEPLRTDESFRRLLTVPASRPGTDHNYTQTHSRLQLRKRISAGSMAGIIVANLAIQILISMIGPGGAANVLLRLVAILVVSAGFSLEWRK